MSGLHSVNATATTTLWNGATCPTCDKQYVGHHAACEPEDLAAKANRLLELARLAFDRRATTGTPVNAVVALEPADVTLLQGEAALYTDDEWAHWLDIEDSEFPEDVR